MSGIFALRFLGLKIGRGMELREGFSLVHRLNAVFRGVVCAMNSKRAALSSLALGLASVLLSIFAVQFSASPAVVPLHCCFLPPLIAAMAYGWRGALLAGCPLGVAYHFMLFPANGWANAASAVFFLAWYLCIGFASEARGRRPAAWNNPHFILLGSVGAAYLLYTVVFPVMYKFNPAPWNGALFFSSRPPEILHAIAVKEIVQMAILLSLSNALLLCPGVRSALGLESRPESRENGRIIALSALGGLLLWCGLMGIEHALLVEPLPALLVELKLHDILALLVILAGSMISGSQVCGYLERRLASEDALRESEKNYREIFDVSIDALFIHDNDGRVLDVNGRMCSMFGYDRDSALKLSIQDISMGLPPYSQSEARKLIGKAMADGTQVFEWRTKRSDGTLFWSEVVLRPCKLRGEDRVIASVRDIESRKRLEEQLAQAQKLESIGRLAGGVAHDFNNHLTVIIGGLDLVCQRSHLDEYARSHLKEVSMAAQRAGTLTKQLLAFSRRGLINPEPLNLNETVEELKKMLSRLIGEDVKLKASLDKRLEPIKADRSQLEQIIMNLAVNARDAMPGGGSLEIATGMADLDAAFCSGREGLFPGRYVTLSVSDTGCGMSEEVKKRMFEPFFTTKPLGKGTGLGLSIVYGAVRQNRGYIDVESEPGKGSSFKMYFPPVSIADELLGSGFSHPEQKAKAGTESVLVVEDDPVIKAYVTEVLEGFGYRVVAFPDGRSALSWAESSQSALDLLLSDVIMPGMNGRELAARLAVIRPGVRTLFMSGYAEDVIATQGILEKGVKLITKPFTVEELAAKTREALDAKG